MASYSRALLLGVVGMTVPDMRELPANRTPKFVASIVPTGAALRSNGGRCPGCHVLERWPPLASSVSQAPALSQTPPQPEGQNSTAAAALAAFGTGLAQGQAAAAANRPVMCTSTKINGVLNTLCH
jgi:hypothetical protein